MIAHEITAAAVAGESRSLIRQVDWAGYEMLLEAFDDAGPRLYYLAGGVELLSPLIPHERRKKLLARMVEVLIEELDIPACALGSTTFRRATVGRGAEPDECYYLSNIDRLAGHDRGDLDILPPPDLVIEVEITAPLLDRLAIYAGLGVPELWRYDGARLVVLVLGGDGRYVESARSRAFPFLPLAGFVQHLEAHQITQETRWIREFRAWVREVVAPLYQP